MLRAPRSHLRSPISHLLAAFLLALCSALAASSASAQGSALGKTSFGKSQNTAEDLQNSLIPGKPNLTKGEKKAEVDPKKLPSKTVKDPLFQGGLMDVNVDWTGDKLGKPRGGPSAANESDQKAQKKTEATDDSKVAAKSADPARDKDSKPSKSDAADDQNKEQKQNSAKSGDKPAASEKSSPSKADGDR